MKGLLFKEWCLGKKTVYSFLAIALGFTLMGILVFLSTIYGNLQDMRVEEPESIEMFATIFIYVPFVLLLEMMDVCNQSIFKDYNTGWMKYGYTLPVSGIKAVGARYLFAGIIIFFSCVYALGNAYIMSAFSGMAITLEVIKNLVFIMLAMMTMFAIHIPLSMKFKSAKAMSAIMTGILVAVYLAGGFLFVNFEKQYGEEAITKLLELFRPVRDIAVYTTPLIAISVVGISFFATVKIYEGREKKC